ncbi:MAG: LamG-like jellyroll fold domain-containing protein, partial [Planctomycetota bacterium]
KPFTWIKVGEEPIKDLEGVRSLTIMGWLKASGMKIGSGGNRILFSLQHSHSGMDLVHHVDGTMRLAVNQWPDKIRNDSSKGKVQVGKWVFFAVTYDTTKRQDNVCWYFGGQDTPAQLDRKTSYNNGPVGEGSGNLVIGNFNKTLQSAGLDRQFRGQIRGLQIYTSWLGTRGALPLEKIRERQQDR